MLLPSSDRPSKSCSSGAGALSLRGVCAKESGIVMSTNGHSRGVQQYEQSHRCVTLQKKEECELHSMTKRWAKEIERFSCESCAPDDVNGNLESVCIFQAQDSEYFHICVTAHETWALTFK